MNYYQEEAGRLKKSRRKTVREDNAYRSSSGGIAGKIVKTVKTGIKPIFVMNFFVFVSVLYIGCKTHGDKLTFEEGELFYKSPVKKADAKKVGHYLVEIGYFTKDRKKSVQLVKEKSTYQVRFVVKDPESLSKDLKEQFKLLGGMISTYALDGANVEVHLCDRHLKTKQTIKVPSDLGNFGQRLIVAKGEVFFKEPVKKETAEKIGNFLKEKGYFTADRRKSIKVTMKDGAGGGEKEGTENKKGKTYEIGFVVPGERTAEIVNSFNLIGSMISKEVLGGAPVVVRLCDASMKCN